MQSPRKPTRVFWSLRRHRPAQRQSEGEAHGHQQGDGVPGTVRLRHGRDRRLGLGGDRQSAGAVFPARRGSRHPRTVRRADRLRPALPHRMAALPGRRRLRHLRPGHRRVLARPTSRPTAWPTRTGRTSRRRSSPRSATCASEPQITEAFRTGAGVGWHEHDEDVFVGCDAFYRPGYVAELVPNWIPALDGVEAKLTAGARVADIGCGLGSSSVLLAEAFPQSTVVGSDYHAESIDLARKKAAEAGVERPGRLRGRDGGDLHRQRLRPGDDVRLPARHGRPGRGGTPGARGAGARTAPGCWSNRSPPISRRRTSTRSAGCSSPGHCSCAFPTRCPRRVAMRWVRRPGKRRSARWRRRPGSPGSGGPRRRRSIWCTRSARSGDRRDALREELLPGAAADGPVRREVRA